MQEKGANRRAWPQTRKALGLVIVLAAFFFAIYFLRPSAVVPDLSWTLVTTREENKDVTFDSLEKYRNLVNTLIKQRNALSLKANSLAKEFTKCQCESLDSVKRQWRDSWPSPEMNQITDEENTVSGLGGWCMEAGKTQSSQHLTDYFLAQFLAGFWAGKIVGSFGDGPGLYKRALDKTGLLKSYTAFDGAPFVETTSDETVRHLDLTVPAFGLPVFDWVLSLEVAEHIPRQYENVFVDNLARHASEGIVISWAKLDQGGLGHVNCRSIEFVVAKLSDAGFELDVDASRRVKSAATLPWLRDNVYVYRRRDGTTADENMA